jgi:hypothetical protein
MKNIQPPIRRTKYLVFDVETTGLIPRQSKNQPPIQLSEYPYVIQFSFVLYDLASYKVIKSYDSFIKIPDSVQISDFVSNLTGITNEICQTKGRPIVEALREFHSAYLMCEGLVAHNIEFDETMIQIEIQRNIAEIMNNTPECSIIFNKVYETLNNMERYCTMKHGSYICNIWTEPIIIEGTIKRKASRKWPKLSELYEALFKETPQNLHNSMEDVKACLKCYLKMRHHISIDI